MKIPKRLTIRVDLEKVLKEHIYQGAKGKYLNLVLFNTPENQFGNDYVVKQDIPQEKQPEDGAPILGNAKCWLPNDGIKNTNGGGALNGNSTPSQQPPQQPNTNDDLPF